MVVLAWSLVVLEDLVPHIAVVAKRESDFDVFPNFVVAPRVTSTAS